MKQDKAWAQPQHKVAKNGMMYNVKQRPPKPKKPRNQ